jgi:hypothetical protein
MAKVAHGQKMLALSSKEMNLLPSFTPEQAAEFHKLWKDNTPAGADKLDAFLQNMVSTESRIAEQSDKMIVNIARVVAICEGKSVDAVKNITTTNATLSEEDTAKLAAFLADICESHTTTE